MRPEDIRGIVQRTADEGEESPVLKEAHDYPTTNHNPHG